jgi:hypothetical protein
MALAFVAQTERDNLAQRDDATPRAPPAAKAGGALHKQLPIQRIRRPAK